MLGNRVLCFKFNAAFIVGPALIAFSSFVVAQATGNPGAVTPTAPPDPRTLVRKWGPEVQGIRVDLTLDKLVYKLGEDVPLHIAYEVLSTDKPVYEEPFRPRSAFRRQSVYSPSFQLILTDNGSPKGDSRSVDASYTNPWSPSSGPIVCPRPLRIGKPQFLDRSLNQLGVLPDHPGVYRLVVTWSAYATHYTSCDTVPKVDSQDKPFVTVSSETVEIQVSGPAKEF